MTWSTRKKAIFIGSLIVFVAIVVGVILGLAAFNDSDDEVMTAVQNPVM